MREKKKKKEEMNQESEKKKSSVTIGINAKQVDTHSFLKKNEGEKNQYVSTMSYQPCTDTLPAR
jgi:hypothetical protein